MGFLEEHCSMQLVRYTNKAPRGIPVETCDAVGVVRSLLFVFRGRWEAQGINMVCVEVLSRNSHY